MIQSKYYTYFLGLFLFLFVTSTLRADVIYDITGICISAADKEKYIATYKDIAIAEMERSGIPASIKLAQGLLESGVGESELARKANNHFGMKCGGAWEGKTYYIKDDDRNANGELIKSCFRVYDTPQQSYIAHTEFLMNPKKDYRYGFLFEYKPTDYEKWAYGLKKAGYATNPKYPNILIRLIEENRLHRFDFMSSDELDPVFTSKEEREKLEEAGDVFMHNDIKTIFIKEGDTPESLAKKYDKSVSELLKYNDMTHATTLDVDARFYLQPKRSGYRGAKKYHIIKAGESMFTISRLYGIKLSKLQKRNRLNRQQEPAIGQEIKLRGWKVRNTPKLRSTKTTSKPSRTTTKPPKKQTTTPKPNAKPKPPKTTPSNNNKTIHTVQSGETLYGISRKYGVSVDKIKTLNQLKDNNLAIGQKLIIRE